MAKKKPTKSKPTSKKPSNPFQVLDATLCGWNIVASADADVEALLAKCKSREQLFAELYYCAVNKSLLGLGVKGLDEYLSVRFRDSDGKVYSVEVTFKSLWRLSQFESDSDEEDATCEQYWHDLTPDDRSLLNWRGSDESTK